MNDKDKTSVENLIIIARYMQDNAVMTSKDEAILAQSIRRAQRLIGVEVEAHVDPVELGELGEININSYIQALKNRKKSLD